MWSRKQANCGLIPRRQCLLMEWVEARLICLDQCQQYKKGITRRLLQSSVVEGASTEQKATPQEDSLVEITRLRI